MSGNHAATEVTEVTPVIPVASKPFIEPGVTPTMSGAKDLLNEMAVAILCGGQGSRMKSNERHKVCFPIDGIPAIIRTVRMFHRLGARKIVLVVGALAENVLSAVSREFPQVAFVYQHEQLGTGHAARIAVEALNGFGHDGPILITMGDKVIEPRVISELAERYVRSRSDLVFVTSAKPSDNGPGSGSGATPSASANASIAVSVTTTPTSST